MDDTKITEDKIDIKKTQKGENENIDTILFDKSLNQIEEILKNLEGKIETKEDMQNTRKIEATYKNDTAEHAIDNTHLRMEELHDFKSEPEIVKNNSFGFYTYLALSIGIIFTIYELLNIYKNFIIVEYPALEPHIEYFYEVIEILAYLVMNLISFLRNLF